MRAREVRQVLGVVRGAVARRQQHLERAAEHLVGGVAEDLLGARVEEVDALLLVDRDDAVRRELHDAREQLGGLRERAVEQRVGWGRVAHAAICAREAGRRQAGIPRVARPMYPPGMPHLAEVRLRLPRDADAYPFTVPAVRALGAVRALALDAPVTCFVGENGSGKSTLLEGIAAAAGAARRRRATTCRATRRSRPRARSRRALTLSWTKRTRARLLPARRGLLRVREAARAERAERSCASSTRSRRSTPRRGRSRGRWASRSGRCARRSPTWSAATASTSTRTRTGRRSCALFGNRFVPGGLYLLDEPEAALSPQSQLALLSMLLDMARSRARSS